MTNNTTVFLICQLIDIKVTLCYNILMKNYIFDFGKVIIEYEPAYMTALRVDDPEDAAAIVEAVFDRRYWDPMDEGRLCHEEIKPLYRERLPERLHAVADEIFDSWIYNIPLIKGIPELIRDIRAAGGRLYLLSNISEHFAENYVHNPEVKAVLDLFDGLIFSAPIKMAKPGKDIFIHILEKYDLAPEDSIFIDDNAGNIATAKEMGINTYTFDGDTRKLREYLGL